MQSPENLLLDSLESSQKLAKELSVKLEKGSVVKLKGNLGAGKTTFAGFVINNLLDIKTNIISPTFTLVNSYFSEVKNCEIYHYDLYRLKKKEEIWELGIEDSILNGITIIEWPEIIESILPEDKNFSFEFSLEVINSEEIRSCKIFGL